MINNNFFKNHYSHGSEVITPLPCDKTITRFKTFNQFKGQHSLSLAFWGWSYFLGLLVSLQFMVGSLELTFTSQSLLRILVPLLPLGLVMVALGLFLLVFLSMRSGVVSVGLEGTIVGSLIVPEPVAPVPVVPVPVVPVVAPFTSVDVPAPTEPAPELTPAPTPTPTPAAYAAGRVQREPANKIAINDIFGFMSFISLLLSLIVFIPSKRKMVLI